MKNPVVVLIIVLVILAILGILYQPIVIDMEKEKTKQLKIQLERRASGAL